MLTGTCSARDHSSWKKTNHFGLESLAPPCFYPPPRSKKKSAYVCVRESVRLCACALHLKVLFCLHMWACVCSVVWWRPGPTPHERRLTDLRTFLQCCSVAARECLNVKLHYPLSLSFLLCFLCYRVLLPDRAQPDSGLCTSVVGYRTGSRSVMTRSRVRLGASRGGRRNQASVSYLKTQQTFRRITTLQWPRGKLFVGDRKQNKPWDWSVLYCHLAATSAVDVTTDDKNNLNSLHGPHLVSPLV